MATAAVQTPASVAARPTQALDLSIVIPCLNEAETLGACIRQARLGIQRSGLEGEIIVADNGSSDGSTDIALSLGARLVKVPQRGYGNASRAGIEAAKGRFVIMGDADLSYDFSELRPFLERFSEGFDLVIGNRFKGGIQPGAMPWQNRWIGNPVLTALGRLFFGASVGDFHCGLRGFTKQAYDQLSLTAGGMEFASEMVVKATFRRLRVTEVGVVLRPDGRSHPPHLRRWRDGWRHLRFMLLFSPRWLFLYPGLALIGFGGLVSAWLLPTGHRLGPIGFDVDTLLVAAAMALVGYQLVIFAVFSKVYATQVGLLPANPWLNRLYRHVKLEVGLAAGVLMVAAGVAALIGATLMWESVSFGVLDPRQSMRLVIPAVTLLAVGVETIFASFFLSILGIELGPIHPAAASTGE